MQISKPFFRCGHERIPINMLWRKRTGRYLHTRGEKKDQAVCKRCFRAKQAQAATRRRERLAEFQAELDRQLPVEGLPVVESCEGK